MDDLSIFHATSVKGKYIWKVETSERFLFFFKIECRPALSRKTHFGAQGYSEFLAFLIARYLNLDVLMPCMDFVKMSLRQFHNTTQVPLSCLFMDPNTGIPYVIGAMSSGLASLREIQYVTNDDLVFYTGSRKTLSSSKAFVDDVSKAAVIDFLALNDDRHTGVHNTLFSLEFLRPVVLDTGAFSMFSGDVCKEHLGLLRCPSIFRTKKFRCPLYNKTTFNFCPHVESIMGLQHSHAPAFRAHLRRYLTDNDAWNVLFQLQGTGRTLTISQLLEREVGSCTHEWTAKNTSQASDLLIELATKRFKQLQLHLRRCASSRYRVKL